MARLKHLLIFSLCVSFSYFVPSVSLNALSKNAEEVFIDDDNSVKLSHSLKFDNDSLSRNYSECNCGEHSISCEYDDNEKKNCTCKPGFAPKISTNTSDVVCTECYCGLYSISCEYDTREEKICTCKDGFAPKFDSITSKTLCTKCDCGSNAVSCDFEFGFKTCVCRDDNVKLGGEICPFSECDCGENSISCVLNRSGKKMCTCKKGFYPIRKLFTLDEECKKCDCGTGATSCEFDYLDQRICRCKKGYAVSTGYDETYRKVQECKKCDCGVDGISCSFGSGKSKQCTCRYGSYFEYDYSSGEEKCKKCSCGPFSVSCKKEYGVKKCTCIEGYYARRPSYGSDEECTKNDGKSTFTSGWKIGTYIAGFIYVGLIILLIVIMQQKRRNSTP